MRVFSRESPIKTHYKDYFTIPVNCANSDIWQKTIPNQPLNPLILPDSGCFQSPRAGKPAGIALAFFRRTRYDVAMHHYEGGFPMSEEFGPNFITLTDEDGNEIELEYVDAIEVDGQTYMAFFPTVDDDADEAAAEEFGLVILKSITENGEELLSTLDSDEELDRVYDLFMEQLMDDEDGDN